MVHSVFAELGCVQGEQQIMFLAEILLLVRQATEIRFWRQKLPIRRQIRRRFQMCYQKPRYSSAYRVILTKHETFCTLWSCRNSKQNFYLDSAHPTVPWNHFFLCSTRAALAWNRRVNRTNLRFSKFDISNKLILGALTDRTTYRTHMMKTRIAFQVLHA